MTKYLALDFPAGDAIKSFARPDDLFSKGTAIGSERISESLREGELRMLWRVDDVGMGIPHAIIGRRGNLEDLLPRLLSQPGIVEPVTALIRTWDIHDLQRMPFGSPRSLDSFMTAGIVGMLIAEIQVAGGQSVDLRRCGLEIARRTLTFSCGTAWSLGMKREDLPELVHRWLEVADLTESVRGLEAISSVGSHWDFLMSLENQIAPSWEVTPQELGRCIHEWRTLVDDRQQGDLLSADFVITTPDLLRLSREARYSAIVKLLDAGTLGERPLNALERGFLISLIDPGSFDFYELAIKYGNGADGTLFAYSLFAGILGGKSTLARFNGFGAHVVLKGFAVAAQLNVDISLHELRIVRKLSSESRMDLRLRSPAVLDVEILPHVVASFAYGSTKRPGTVARSTGLSEEQLGSLDEALRALDFATSVLSDIKGSASNARGGRRRAGR